MDLQQFLIFHKILMFYHDLSNLSNFKFLCLKLYFSLGSSPITIHFQFLNSFNILIIAVQINYNLLIYLIFQQKLLYFLFLEIFFNLFILGYTTSHFSLFFILKPSKNLSFTQLLTNNIFSQFSIIFFFLLNFSDPLT